ncbi:MAG: hypothetical protein ACK5LX_13935 [Oscillospiraceae bacterium]
MGRIVKGYWDCPSCGKALIDGLTRECPGCGKPRGENTSFYRVGPGEYVSTETVDRVGKQPDWFCEYCQSLNNAKLNRCFSCGSPRTDSRKNYFDVKG